MGWIISSLCVCLALKYIYEDVYIPVASPYTMMVALDIVAPSCKACYRVRVCMQTPEPRAPLFRLYEVVSLHMVCSSIHTYRKILKVLHKPTELCEMMGRRPQNRERLYFVGFRSDLGVSQDFKWQVPCTGTGRKSQQC